MASHASAEVTQFVDRFFRDKWREIIAVLTRHFGTQRLDAIENSTQKAMEKALKVWSVSGIPSNPGGWVYTVAKNDILDTLRAERRTARAGEAVAFSLYDENVEEPAWLGPLEDDVLRMILVCCHPRLNIRECVAITLRYICGLGTFEIAQATLSSDEAVRKLITRTKAKIRAKPIPFDLPARAEQSERLSRAIRIVYLLFNEGYAAAAGEDLIRAELCAEAKRLAELLLASHAKEDGRIWALAALMSFQASRLPSRVDRDGQIVLLRDQDRGLWDGDEIKKGFYCLDKAIDWGGRSSYHLEAAIAACHAVAPSYDETDWAKILEYYDDLQTLAPSPVIEMNRAVAVMMLEGPEAGIAVLQALRGRRELRGNLLLPAVLADFHGRLGQLAQAKLYYEEAIALARNVPVRRFLLDRMSNCSIQ